MSIANFIMNQKRDYVASIEKNYGLSVRIEGDLNLVSPEYSIEKLKSATRILSESEPALVTADGRMELSEEENVREDSKDEERPDGGDDKEKAIKDLSKNALTAYEKDNLKEIDDK